MTASQIHQCWHCFRQGEFSVGHEGTKAYAVRGTHTTIVQADDSQDSLIGLQPPVSITATEILLDEPPAHTIGSSAALEFFCRSQRSSVEV